MARYLRQTVLPEIGQAGQERLLQGRVLLIGAGGLGCAASVYLATLGVGYLRIADADHVELSNLHRQILHAQHDVGALKIDSAAASLQALNPALTVDTHNVYADADSLPDLLKNIDVVVDASDNFATRYVVNQACLAARLPLVSGAAIRWQGQLSVWRFDEQTAGCYACLYPPSDETADNCSTAGIAPPIVGMIGSGQALLTMQLLLQQNVPHGILQCLDGLAVSPAGMQWRRLTVTPDPVCSVCG